MLNCIRGGFWEKFSVFVCACKTHNLLVSMEIIMPSFPLSLHLYYNKVCANSAFSPPSNSIIRIIWNHHYSNMKFIYTENAWIEWFMPLHFEFSFCFFGIRSLRTKSDWTFCADLKINECFWWHFNFKHRNVICTKFSMSKMVHRDLGKAFVFM